MGNEPAKNPFEYAQQFVEKKRGRFEEQRAQQLQQMATTGDVLAPKDMDPQHATAFRAFKRHGIRPEFNYKQAYRDDYTGAFVRDDDEIIERAGQVRPGGQYVKPFTDEVLQHGLELAKLDESIVRSQGRVRDQKALPAELNDPEKARATTQGIYEKLPDKIRQMAAPSVLDQKLIAEAQRMRDARDTAEAHRLAIDSGQAKEGDAEFVLQMTGTGEQLSSQFRSLAPTGPAAKMRPQTGQEGLTGFLTELADFGGKNKYFEEARDQDKAIANIQSQTSLEGHKEIAGVLRTVSPFSGYTGEKYPISQYILPIGQTSDGKFGVDVLEIRHKLLGNLIDQETQRTGKRPDYLGARYGELVDEANKLIDKWAMEQRDVPLIDRRGRKDRARDIVRGEDWTGGLQAVASGPLGWALWAAEGTGLTDNIGQVAGIDDLSGKVNTVVYGITAPVRSLFSSFDTFLPGGEDLEQYRVGRSVESLGQGPFSAFLSLGGFSPIAATLHNVTLTDNIYDSWEKSLVGATEDIIAGKGDIFAYQSDLSKSFSEWNKDDWINAVMLAPATIATLGLQTGIQAAEKTVGGEISVTFSDWVPFLGEMPDIRLSQLANLIPSLGAALFEPDAISLATFGTGKAIKVAKPALRASYLTRSIKNLDELKTPEALAFLRGENVDYLEKLKKTDRALHDIVVQELATALEVRGQWSKTSRDASSPITPSIPGHMKELVEHLADAEKAADDIEALSGSVNAAATSIKNALEAIAQEEVHYKFLEDYIRNLPDGPDILESVRQRIKGAKAEDLGEEYRVSLNAAGNPHRHPTTKKKLLKFEYDLLQSTKRVTDGLTRTNKDAADPNLLYNPDSLLFREPDSVTGEIKVSHFNFDEQFDVASTDWANDVASAIAGTDYYIGPITVTAAKKAAAPTRAAPTPGTYTVPKKTANNKNYQALENHISDWVDSYGDKDALRAVVGQEELPGDILNQIRASIRLAKKDGAEIRSSRVAWIQHALRKVLSASPAASPAARPAAAAETVTKISRDDAFNLKDLLSSIKNGEVDERLRSLWISEIEQLRLGGFFDKVANPWENLPASTRAIREALKARAEVLRARFDTDIAEINRLSKFQQQENLAAAMASASRRIGISKKTSISTIKLALQKIAENGWDAYIGKGIKATVPDLARKAIKSIDADQAGKAWKFISKLAEQGRLDKFAADALAVADVMRKQAKTVQDFESIWVDTISRIQGDLARGRDVVLRGDLPPEPALEVSRAESVLNAALVRDDKGNLLIPEPGKLTLDVGEYNKMLADRYGISEAVTAFKTPEWREVYAIRSSSGTVEITAQQNALLTKFENFLQTEKRSTYLKKKNIYATATLFAAMNDPTLPISMNFWRDPGALYSTIRAIVAKFKAKVDPDLARFGVVSRAVAAVGRSMREASWRTMDEISAIQRYAQQNNLDPAELLKTYLTSTIALRLGREDQFYAQRTIMNRGVPPWEKFRRIMREPPRKMVGQAAEDAEKGLLTSDTFLNSIARMWLRSDDPAESSVRQIVKDIKIAIGRTGTDEDYADLFARIGQPAIEDVLQDYDTFVKFTYDVAQYHKKLVREPYEKVLADVRVANTMAIIVGSGAVLDDMVTRMIQAVGPKMTVGQANDMMNIIKGDYFRVEDAGQAMDAFLRAGIPFTQSRRLLADTDGRKIMNLYVAARGDNVAIIPSRIYEEISRELAKFERQFDPLTRMESSTLGARARNTWARFMGELRQGMTTGLLLNAPHWVNTVWGDFWQMQETVGFGTASRVTASNLLVTGYRVTSGLGSMTMETIPGIGPKLKNYSIELKRWVARRNGLNPDDPEVLDRILPGILETYLRADIIRAWDHRFNGTFDLGDGYTLAADDLRRMMAEDGVFDFSLAQDQIELNQIIQLKTLERQYRNKLRRARKDGASPDELETIRLELADVQRARAEAEGPILGAAMRQVRRVPGQRQIGEILDFSRDVARESMQHFQQRQRAALYIDMLRKTKSRDRARQAVGRALFDWNHGLTPFEMQTFSRYFLFYRFTRLNLTEGMRVLLGPFTEFEEGLNLAQVMTGRSRLSRTRAQLQIMEQFRQQVLQAQGDPLATGRPATQEEMRRSILQNEPPSYFKFQHGIVVPLDVYPQKFYRREFGQAADVGFARLPEMSTVQRYEALYHTTSLLALAAGMIPGQPLGTGKGGTQTIRDSLEFVADQMTPGLSQVSDAAIASLVGEAKFNGSRPLSKGQEVMYREILRGFGAEGYLTQINDKGRLGVPQFLHLMFSNLPYASSQGRRIAEALGANPGREWDEYSANAFKTMVGLQPSVYSSIAEYDKKQKDAAKALKEIQKNLERRPSNRPAVPYPYNLDD